MTITTIPYRPLERSLAFQEHRIRQQLMRPSTRSAHRDIPKDSLYWTEEKRRKVRAATNHKLSWEAVLEIRELWSMGGLTKQDLSRMYLVSRRTIQDVLSRATWGHLTVRVQQDS